MSDHVWVKIESMPTYFWDENPLADAGDYRVFIDQSLEQLHADAWRCYRKHGRGVIVLERPKGAFVEGWYGLPRADHPSGLERTLHKDLLRYDPTSELLVGIGDGISRPIRVWRLKVEPTTPTTAWQQFDLTA